MTKIKNEIRKKRDNKGIFLRLCKYVFHYWYLFVPAIVMTLLSNQLSLLGPKFSGDAIDAMAVQWNQFAVGIESKDIYTFALGINCAFAKLLALQFYLYNEYFVP